MRLVGIRSALDARRRRSPSMVGTPEPHEAAVAAQMLRHRAAVWNAVDHAPHTLSVAEVRQAARQRDPSLSSVLLACAADDLRRQGVIRLAH